MRPVSPLVDPAARSRLVAGIYSRVASAYDLVVTRLLVTAGIPGGRDTVAAWAGRLADSDVPVLDLPTGTGEYLGVLPSPVVGVDLAAGMLQRAHGRHPDRPLARADAFHLPFADATFGAVFSALGLHLFPRPAEAVDEMVRVLRPGGRLLGAVPVWLASPQFVGGPAALRRVVERPGLQSVRFDRHRFVVLFELVRVEPG